MDKIMIRIFTIVSVWEAIFPILTSQSRYEHYEIIYHIRDINFIIACLYICI